ncbi:uncharacterized protein LAESUDRAFT_755889 [Laetiporus sulphureus 93-53]|uniref:HTH La-type RNA-binding domain-containing protein n=1 Tax=Laetiporus sulphureus 93-53 TaxID=1314785 RepID=A0A165GI66_9APHY|nr:uncharacterized protein LAESUDRAFT_755889 [Laetiporus sulphureus 93-53]KZT10382.1 hypothetical protein LAESUDRAFT_755889 [Laetiporus sulphureus 93-53]
MISPQPSAPSYQPLSYADRAKQAQKITPSPSQHPAARNLSPATGTSAVGPETDIAMNAGMSAISSSSSIGEDAVSSTPSSIHQSSGPSSSLSSQTNGDHKYHGNNSQKAAPQPQLTSSAASKPAAAPPVNVWNARIEQMAQARTRSHQGVDSAQRPAIDSMESNDIDDLSARPDKSNTQDSTGASASSSSVSHNVMNQRISPPMTTKSTTSNLNGSTNDEDDAFVVRPRRPIPSIVDDSDSWPEVGKSVSSGIRQTEENARGAQGHDPERSREGSQSHGTSRKSVSLLLLHSSCCAVELRQSLFQKDAPGIGEKTKWVQIPPSELQAAADAQQRSQHVRNRSHQHSRHPGSGYASASGSGSQAQSRTHSAVGTRHSSHASSVSQSQSQSQSRTGSAHSSPPVFPRGGKRLPEEGGASGYSAGSAAGVSSVASRSVSKQSSTTGSPQTFHQALPPTDFIPGGAMGFRPLPPSLARRGSGPAEQANDVPSANGNTPAYYTSPPAMPPPANARRSYHTPHSSGSPVQPSYTLPTVAPIPTVYPPPLHGGQGPQYSAYAGTPPHAAYSPYGYGYPPYVYWPPAPVPQSHSPSVEGTQAPVAFSQPRAPSERESVTSQREGGSVMPPPTAYTSVSEVQREGSEAEASELRTVRAERGRKARELSFGSIRLEEVSAQAAAPEASAKDDASILGLSVGEAKEGGQEESAEKPAAPFAIGVAPGEAGPSRIRSRTRTQSKGHSWVLGEASVAAAVSLIEQSDGSGQATNDAEGAEPSAVGQKGAEEIEAGIKVIDLTEPIEMKWVFGTTKPSDSEIVENGEKSHAGAVSSESALPASSLPPIVTSTNGLASAHLATSSDSSAVPPVSSGDAASSDEWKVKDYGYGFGRKDYAPPMTGEERNARERREFQPDKEHFGRPRRGSVGGGYAYERGGFGGRRGRGFGGPGGRGAYHSRTHSRGGNVYQPSQSRQPPFVMQPSTQQADQNGYYAPLSTGYYASAYDPYAYSYGSPPQNLPSVPPLPMPQSTLSFPLDPTRYYLLGQLEYYLSPQNMAQDFFLRQRMDSRGWISIPLLASFKRVKQLTLDQQLVKDVLILSSLVEVKDEWVRMRQWEQFVLPNAVESTVDGERESSQEHTTQPQGGVASAKADVANVEEGDEGDGEEEEEEEVVFVLGKDAEPSWAP